MTFERPTQLDIFEHSRDVALRNDVQHAIDRRDAGAAQHACEQLAQEFAHDAALPALRLLTDTLLPCSHEMLLDHDALAAARREIEERIAPAATRVFGKEAADWLAPLWRDLAQRAEMLKFQPERPLDHPAPLWLRARDWKAAASAVATIEGWHRRPQALAWMAEARLHAYGLGACWPIVAELAWLAPSALADLARRTVPDPLLCQLVRRFAAAFDGEGDESDLAWFPAWLLIDRPDLEPGLAGAPPAQDSAPERALRLLLELLGLEREGEHHAVVQRREALRDLSWPLYSAYLAAR
ncbi:hypothetical protein HLB44_00715 [Aquincola sp. S2]|uniref:Uncharacterized protein n=1 Tax=Pseudaquabacterium terrae TaxID=2732868 RepID=A0ABX2E962_9BURK|nr:hypothetical protein [Aquabacterium terrae]NRF65494.1 hypothetical protein [Aquabacterium terrae]